MRDRNLARVLVVEDDLALAQIVAGHLRARGHDARVAASVELARAEIAAGFRPTVVLLDINLPEVSGWDLMRSGELSRIGSPPVYVVSATSISPSRLHEFGAAGFLPKPFALPTLIEIVERAGMLAAEPSQAGIGGGLDEY